MSLNIHAINEPVKSGRYRIVKKMTNYEQTEKMTVEELKQVGGNIFEWNTCATCGKECITTLFGPNPFEEIRALGLHENALPLGSNKEILGKFNVEKLRYDVIGHKTQCHKCSKIASDTYEAKHIPRLARRLTRQISAIYRCPIHNCNTEVKTKNDLTHHFTTQHDTFNLRQELNSRDRERDSKDQ